MLTTSEEFSSALYRHHEQTLSVQWEFEKQVRSLMSVMENMGTPFLEDSPDLLVLDTHDIMDEKVVDTVENIEIAGACQNIMFLEEYILKKEKSIFDPILKNKFPLFICPSRNPVQPRK